jgi:hypothetical protein
MIQIISWRIFPLTQGIRNGMLNISQIQDSATFQVDGNPQIELEIVPLRIHNPQYPETDICNHEIGISWIEI